MRVSPILPLSFPIHPGSEAVSLPAAPNSVAIPLLPPAFNPIPTTLPVQPLHVPASHRDMILPSTPDAGLPLSLFAAVSEAAEHADKLGRVFDKRRAPQPRPFEITEDRHYTIPEKDLLDEIGVASLGAFR